MNSPITRIPDFAPKALVTTGWGKTHVGLVRKINEDALLLDPAGSLWAVADGMGGYGHGDVAADIVTECLSEISTFDDPRIAINAGITKANARIFDRSSAPGWGAMGATVVALYLDLQAEQFVIGWAGDSRIYRLRDGALTMLSHDHSLVQEMVDAGSLDARAAEDHPQSHVVTRAVGAEPRVDVSFGDGLLRDGDVYMLCSDGLSRCVTDDNLREILASSIDPEESCDRLIDAALAEGAPDNVSVIVVHLSEA